MTNEEALQWCAEHDIKVCFYDQEKKHPYLDAVAISRIGDDRTVLGQGATFLEAVEDAVRIQESSPERKELGKVAWEAWHAGSTAHYDDEEVWRRIAEAVANRVLELQRVAVEASE